MSATHLPVLLVDEMEVERKQHRRPPNHAETFYSPASGSARIAELDVKWLGVAQRPTKTLLTLGTRLYDDLCCVAQDECSVNRGPLSKRTPKWIGEEANVLKGAVCVV
jgi:hypothetical protein